MDVDKISAVIITKNEAQNIAACISSLTCVDEIVVMDTGSTDNTVSICESMGAIVHSTSWSGFGPAKRKAVEAAAHDWILSIDADEVLSPALSTEIVRMKTDGFGIYSYRIKRLSYYLGQPINYCGWNKDQPLRLFNRLQGTFNDAPVHESVITSAPKQTCKNLMHHYTYPTLESHFAKMKLYAELSAGKKKRVVKSSPLLAGALKFIKMYVLQRGFLDGYKGFLLCKNSAWGVWYKYHLLCKR